jgi:putative hydrolase of the HAD superfamily
MVIKNVVFDVGNVLVKWAPYEVFRCVLPEFDAEELYKDMSPSWIELNLGTITELEAIKLYAQQLNISEEKIAELLHELKLIQTPLPGSLELLQDLYDRNVPLYSITDNTKEIIEYHRTHSDFLDKFIGVIVSADVGLRKPDPRIYHCLFDRYSVNPKESVFIDDLLQNVEGARAVGMQAIQFIDAESCRVGLAKLGLPV